MMAPRSMRSIGHPADMPHAGTPHWAIQYIGTPWESGAQGPHAFDCWSFVRHVQREHFCRTLPIVDIKAENLREVCRAFDRHNEHANWVQVENFEDGDCLELGSNTHPSHVGVWVDVDGGGCLHCVKGWGVVFQSLTSLRADYRLIKGWRHAGNRSNG